MDERRSSRRLSVNLDAIYEGDAGKHSARVTDLSEKGCYLDSVGDVTTGELVCFRVLLPDGDWLYLEGEIRHHKHRFGFGVRFVDLGEEQREKLQWLLTICKEAGAEAAVVSADLVQD